MDPLPIDQLRLILCYHKNDQKLKDELITHLSSRLLSDYVTYWSNDDVLPGEKAGSVFQDKLLAADAAVILLSAGLLSDENLFNCQLLPLIDRQKVFNLHLIPVVASHCGWQHLSDLAGLKPLNEQEVMQAMKPDRRDEIFARLSNLLILLAKRKQSKSVIGYQTEIEIIDLPLESKSIDGSGHQIAAPMASVLPPSLTPDSVLTVPAVDLSAPEKTYIHSQIYNGPSERPIKDAATTRIYLNKNKSFTISFMLLIFSFLLNIVQFAKFSQAKQETALLDRWRRSCLTGSHVDCVQLEKYYEFQCKLGDTFSCLNAGVMYESSIDLEKNYQQAAELFNQACGKENMNGCYNLASLYLKGNGVVRDTKRALDLYEKACAATNGKLCVNLGKMYAEGVGVTKNTPKAVSIYQTSCRLGELTACTNIGIMYGRGEGVGRDVGYAQEYLQPACEKDESSSACMVLAEIYENDTAYKADVIKYLKLACKFGGKDRCYKTGLFYEKQKDYISALQNYDIACKHGVNDGCFAAGLIQGSSNKRSDFPLAADYYKISCENDHWKSCNNLGRLYEDGTEVEQDSKKSLLYYYRACDHNHPTACYNLGLYYQHKKSSIEDANVAEAFYEKSCQLGDQDACNKREKRLNQ